jgi:hypothetical protein
VRGYLFVAFLILSFSSVPGYVVVDDVKVQRRIPKVKSGFKPFYYGKGSYDLIKPAPRLHFIEFCLWFPT